jgi:peptidyl-prolyl cis-trans isomerase B (cyclophilin B)
MLLKRSLAALATLVAVCALAGCSDDSSSPQASDTAPTADQTGPPCTYTSDGRAAAKKVDLPPDHATGGSVDVTIVTGVGDIKATLDGDATPCTVNSFVSLAEQGYFDDTTCHRLTTSGIFVLQCGDPTATGSGGPGYSFADELTGDEKYGAGTLAMANAGPDTNGSQFFIVYADSQLPPSYTVFGTIDDAALKTVTDVADQGTTDGGPDGAPKQPVDIKTVTID